MSTKQNPQKGLMKRMQLVLLVLIVILVGLGFAATELVKQQSIQISDLKIRLVQSQNRPMTTGGKSDEIGDTGKDTEPEKDAWSTVSASTTEKLRYFAPFDSKQIQKIIELDKGVVVMQTLFNDQLQSSLNWDQRKSVWYIDGYKKQISLLDEPIGTGYASEQELGAWTGGAVITKYTSPGEAVSDLEKIYFGKDGKFIASSKTGDFYNKAGTASLLFGSKKIELSLVQDECGKRDRLPDSDAYDPSAPTPTTTVRAIKVNGVSKALPHPMVMRCTNKYEAYEPVGFAVPEYDSKRFIFDLGGMKASISATGDLTYAAAESFKDVDAMDNDGYDPSMNSLYRVDAYGEHLVVKDIRKDPVIAELRKNQNISLVRESEDEEKVIYTVYGFLEYNQPSFASVVFDKKQNRFR